MESIVPDLATSWSWSEDGTQSVIGTGARGEATGLAHGSSFAAMRGAETRRFQTVPRLPETKSFDPPSTFAPKYWTA